MASRVIFSDVFRLSYPHLDKPQEPQNPTDTPKFGFAMMFPQSGICPINNQPTSHASIWAALDEVCMEQWSLSFEQASAVGMGVQFPPRLKDGNTVFEKDGAGNPIPNKVNPNSAGMNILSCKNVDRIGCVDPTGTKDIEPSALYAGCWARAQLEVSAYDGKAGRVIVVKGLNIQMAYDDTRFGNRANVQVGAAAFAGQAIADTNVAAGVGQGGAMTPVTPAASGAALNAPAAQAKIVMNAGEASYEEFIKAGWTDDMIIAQGKGTRQAAPATPAAPAVPATPATPSAPAVPATPATPATPSAPAVPATPAAPNSDPVIMNAGELPYAEYVKAGWTAEMLIQHGKAKANYLNPA